VLAVVMTGAGQHFSTGADLKSMAPAMMEKGGINDVLRRGSGRVTTLMIDFPKLIVAAVNGPVAGYPAALLGLFDVVYVSEKASYSVPFLQLGIVPEACSSYTLPRTVGVSKANEILLTGRTVSADELVALGIASAKLSAENFADAVVAKVAAQVKSTAPSSVLHSKRLLRPTQVRAALHAVNEEETLSFVAQFAAGVPMKRFAAVQQRLANNKKSKL
jgi:peroxisomal 3,2-trans-enoyl-CoA isomerase